MKTLKLFLLFCMVSISSSANPECQPQNATKKYDPMLFVFVGSRFILPTQTNLHRTATEYILKQFTCSIPTSDKIQTYVLDYTDGVLDQNVEFYDSSKTIEKLATLYSASPSLAFFSFCNNYKKSLEKFQALVAVKARGPNVRYIVPIWLVHRCVEPNLGSQLIPLVLRDLSKDGRNYHILIHEDGTAYFDVTDNKAPEHLVEASKTIIGSHINDTFLEEQPTASFFTPIFIETLIIGAIFLIVFSFLMGFLRAGQQEWKSIQKRIMKKEKKERKNRRRGTPTLTPQSSQTPSGESKTPKTPTDVSGTTEDSLY